MHWIVVRGVQTHVEPPTGSTYAVQGLWINNPVYENNEPHSASDPCGSGGTHGVENQWVSYATWQGTYFTGCNYDSTTGSNQFISVCDPDQPDIELPRRYQLERPANGREIIDPRMAVRLIVDGIQQNRLDEDEKVADRLRRPSFEEPMLVKRLDEPDAYYYLAPAMVWRPCRESYSPHMPFWQLTSGSQTLYIRADGEIFTHLTTTGSGV